jgi:hypothetical protein
MLYCFTSTNTYAAKFLTSNSLYLLSNVTSDASQMQVTGYCNSKFINPFQTYSITYSDLNGSNYSYALNPPTLSGSYYTTTFNDNSFSLPSGNYTLKMNGWCGTDTINPLIKKIKP